MDDRLTVLVYLFWAGLGLTATLLVGFTILWTSQMPKGRVGDDCLPECWLPPIYPWTWGSTQYRCKECGQQWSIRMDLTLPVEEYRHWEAKVRKDRKAQRAIRKQVRQAKWHKDPRRTGVTSGGWT